MCLWDANERLATETMMDKAMTITNTKTLWGEDPDKRNPCSASICFHYSHFRVQSYLQTQFLYFFCLNSKNNTQGVCVCVCVCGGGGALPYKPIWDILFFRVSFFSINS